jgi:hypothetical protein
LIVASSLCLAHFNDDLVVADSKKSAGESVLADCPDATERFSSSIDLEKT